MFQAEDQRNWIDASTKIYSTPVDAAEAGDGAARHAHRAARHAAAADGARRRRPPHAGAVRGRSRGRRAALRRRTDRPPAGDRRPRPPARSATRSPPICASIWISPATRPGDARGASGRGPARSQPARRSSSRCTCPDDAGAAARALARVDLDGLDVARVLAFTIGHDTTQPATLDAVRAWRARHAGARVRPDRHRHGQRSRAHPPRAGAARGRATRCAGRWTRRRTPPT